MTDVARGVSCFRKEYLFAVIKCKYKVTNSGDDLGGCSEALLNITLE